jgi:hypothetical protein
MLVRTRPSTKTKGINLLHISILLKKVKITVFGPHTKTLIPTETGHELIVEMVTPPFVEHTAAFRTNSVLYIITPPLSSSSKVYTMRK